MTWEEEIGIGAFLTDYRCRGRIKEKPEDFIVEEEGILGKAEVRILFGRKADLVPRGSGEYLYVVLEKRDWDLNDVLKEVSRRLKVGRDRISFAGTKDKFAVTAQWISLWRVTWKDLKEVKIKDVAFHTPVYQPRKLKRGQLRGNWFTIKVRGCEIGEPVPERFLNYFGHQRFGSYRFVSHLVGRELLRENYEEAVWIYLTRTSPWEPKETQEARKRLEEERDPKKALAYFPRRLRKERVILQKLAEGKDFKRALLSLPKNLVALFIHAYQSYLFNHILTERVEVETPKDEETGIVPGYRVSFSPGMQGEIEKKVLEEEGVELKDFRRWKKFGTYGERRKLIERARDLRIKRNVLSFFLPKNTYATSYLRELLKPESPVGFLFSQEKVKEA